MHIYTTYKGEKMRAAIFPYIAQEKYTKVRRRKQNNINKIK